MATIQIGLYEGTLQPKYATAAEWATVTYILKEGELGVEIDTLKGKLGNGTSPWASLPYAFVGAPGKNGKNGHIGVDGDSPKGPDGDPGGKGPNGTFSGIHLLEENTRDPATDTDIFITDAAGTPKKSQMQLLRTQFNTTNPSLGQKLYTGKQFFKREPKKRVYPLTGGSGIYTAGMDKQVLSFSLNSSQASTITFANAPTAGRFRFNTLHLTNSDQANFAIVNWPASVRWAGGKAPDLDPMTVTSIGFLTYDAGATWFGFVVGVSNYV